MFQSAVWFHVQSPTLTHMVHLHSSIQLKLKLDILAKRTLSSEIHPDQRNLIFLFYLIKKNVKVISICLPASDADRSFETRQTELCAKYLRIKIVFKQNLRVSKTFLRDCIMDMFCTFSELVLWECWLYVFTRWLTVIKVQEVKELWPQAEGGGCAIWQSLRHCQQHVRAPGDPAVD